MTRRIKVAASIADIAAADWDACAGPSDPFISHSFLLALEQSGSATRETGWSPLHLVATDADGQCVGVMPAYGKSHSYGEYVFDHGWADAYEQAGGRYYPKLQIAVPFSPVIGPRVLAKDKPSAAMLIAGAQQLCAEAGLSGAHATFISGEQAESFAQAGWLIRHDQQFHWHNRGYATFEDFLASLSSSKRKMIRKERQTALENGIRIEALTGSRLLESHWDHFWRFYQDTGARKWGQPYLTRRFFSLLGETMADRVLLLLAYRDGQPIAGALNLIGSECLYGRYWGCIEDHSCLHFELCYYQAIDYAITHGLALVQAGAQGPHKIARGYDPVITRSAHYIVHPGLRSAIADFLLRERVQVGAAIDYLGTRTPYRRIEEAE